MSDTTTGAAGAPVPAAAGFIGGFAPAALELDPSVESPVAAPAPDPAPKAETAPEEPKQPLAEVIRRAREERLARETETRKVKDSEARFAEAQAEIKRLRDADPEADILAYAKAKGWSKEKQLLMGQMLLYDIVPEKATPEVRQRLFEAKQAEREREREAKLKADNESRAVEAEKAQYQAFVGAVAQTAQSFEPGSYPESEAWFGDDHDTYVRSLVQTALNMATVATKEGRVADLNPANLARALEAEVTRKMTARDERRGKRTPAQPGQQTTAQPVGGGQPAESTKGMTGAGTPRPKATTDAERIQRAVEAAWGRR